MAIICARCSSLGSGLDPEGSKDGEVCVLREIIACKVGVLEAACCTICVYYIACYGMASVPVLLSAASPATLTQVVEGNVQFCGGASLADETVAVHVASTYSNLELRAIPQQARNHSETYLKRWMYRAMRRMV